MEKILLIFLIPIFLCGCSHDNIHFNRDSAAEKMINNTKNNSSGVVILKDENSNFNSQIQFGPKEINFDMPIKIK